MNRHCLFRFVDVYEHVHVQGSLSMSPSFPWRTRRRLKAPLFGKYAPNWGEGWRVSMCLRTELWGGKMPFTSSCKSGSCCGAISGRPGCCIVAGQVHSSTFITRLPQGLRPRNLKNKGLAFLLFLEWLLVCLRSPVLCRVACYEMMLSRSNRISNQIMSLVPVERTLYVFAF